MRSAGISRTGGRGRAGTVAADGHLQRLARPPAARRRRRDANALDGRLVELHAAHDDRLARRRRRGGPRRGRDLRRGRARAASLALGRPARALRSSRSPPRSTGSTCSRAAIEQQPARDLPPLGDRVCGARPGAAPSRRRSARRSAASRSRSPSSRRRARPRSTAARPLPALRFKLDPTPEWTDEVLVDASRRAATSTCVDLKGQYKGTAVDNPRRPGALPARRRGLPGRLDRGSGADARDRRGARAAPRPRSPGTRRSTRGPTSRRCRSRRSAST